MVVRSRLYTGSITVYRVRPPRFVHYGAGMNVRQSRTGMGVERSIA